MSTIQEIRTALERVRAEQDRLRSEKTTILLQLEVATREEERLIRQLKAVIEVPSSRRIDVSGRRAV